MEAVLGDLEDPAPASGAELVRHTLRHPIYVHSKLMIVDDDYIVIGSANINQRSMAERETQRSVWAPFSLTTPSLMVCHGGTYTHSAWPCGQPIWGVTVQCLRTPAVRSV